MARKILKKSSGNLIDKFLKFIVGIGKPKPKPRKRRSDFGIKRKKVV